MYAYGVLVAHKPFFSLFLNSFEWSVRHRAKAFFSTEPSIRLNRESLQSLLVRNGLKTKKKNNKKKQHFASAFFCSPFKTSATTT
jgi:hypothetical protein